ncbi:MAG: hypothetical protein B7X34_03270 [Acidobacteriia bacterium 12-62-4]|nr:MAG: hypothetical protein B7X34_03270 [Acidobacteriia bacterium 12-62-4]
MVYDPPTRSLRSIIGIVGAAQLGESILEDLDWASVAPDGRVSIIRRANQLYYVHGNATAQTVQAHESAVPDDVLWAHDSRSAFLFWRKGKSGQRITIQSDGRVAIDPVVALKQEGDITAVAGSPAGSLLLAIDGSGIHLWDVANDTTILVAPIRACHAIVLADDKSQAWAVDGESGVLYKIELSSGQLSVASAETDTLLGVTVMAITSANRGILLANPTKQSLYLLRMDNMEIGHVASLEAPITMFQALGRRSLMLLGHRAKVSESIVLYDELRTDTFFVPVLEEKQ